MTIFDKLSTMPDADLGNLLANAQRLGGVGTAAQRESAAELLPAVEAELAVRRSAAAERTALARTEAAQRRAAAPKVKAPAKPRGATRAAASAERLVAETT